jgi:glycosyltransferase involved in cell wall biosynthesis
MQSYEPLRKHFDLVAFVPHKTFLDTSSISIPQERLWCPIQGRIILEREKRKWQSLQDAVTGRTFSLCGLADRLRGFDLYHVMDQYYCFSFEAALAKRNFGGKLIVSQWENIPRHNEEKFMERHIKATVRDQADLFLAMSDLSKQALLEEGVPESKICNLRGGVDTGHFTPGKPDLKLRESIGIPRDAYTVLYVGRLSKSKGVFTLLKTAQRFRDQNENIHFLLVGRDEEGVGEWVARKGLSEQVSLVGQVPYADMPGYYRLADTLVLPSLKEKRQQEQFGYVLAEALACGLPVLGSDCGAIPEVIGDEKRIFPWGSAKELHRLILYWREKAQLPPRKAARKRALEHYSSKKLSKSIADIYFRLLSPDGYV